MLKRRGDDASIYAESFDDTAPPPKRPTLKWFKNKLKVTSDNDLDHTASYNQPVRERFEKTLEDVGWCFASLRLPDTADANRATRSYVMLLAALLLLGELSPLFLSMPQTAASIQAAAADGDTVVISITLTDEGGDGSYAWNLPADEASVLAAITDENNAASDTGGYIGLGLDAPSIAIVGALTAFCAAGLRRLIAKKVEVSSPWVALRFGGCALVASAVVLPALNRLGSSPAPVWFGIL